MKKKLQFFSLVILLPLLLLGCNKKLEYNEIQGYSDTILSNALTSLSNNDYDTFYSLLSDDLAESYTLPTFQKESAILLTTVGVFEKIEYDTGEVRNGYNFAIYNATFSHSEEMVRVSVAYKQDDENHKIYELYLYSEELNNASNS